MSLVIGNELKDFLYQSDVAYKEASDAHSKASDAHSKLSEEITKHSTVGTSSWFGKFVSVFNRDSGILAWIGRQICKIWDKFKNECEIQKKISLCQIKQIELTQLSNTLSSLNETLTSVTVQAQKRWQPIIDLFGSIEALNEQVTFCGNDLLYSDFTYDESNLKAFPRGYILRGHIKKTQFNEGTYFLAFRGMPDAPRSSDIRSFEKNIQHLRLENNNIWTPVECSKKQPSLCSVSLSSQKVEVVIPNQNINIEIMNSAGKTEHFATLKFICTQINRFKIYSDQKREARLKYNNSEAQSKQKTEDALPYKLCERFLKMHRVKSSRSKSDFQDLLKDIDFEKLFAGMDEDSFL